MERRSNNNTNNNNNYNYNYNYNYNENDNDNYNDNLYNINNSIGMNIDMDIKTPGLPLKKSLSDKHIRTSLDIYDPKINQNKNRRPSKLSLQNSSEEEEEEQINPNNSIFSGVDLSKIENESMVLNKIPQEDSKKSNNFIENNYKFKRTMTIFKIKEGILQKKSPWFHYNTRKVVLDSTPKIEYIDPKTNRIKVIYYFFSFNLNFL